MEDYSLLSSFVCGIKKLDDFIHNGLLDYIEKVLSLQRYRAIYNRGSCEKGKIRAPRLPIHYG